MQEEFNRLENLREEIDVRYRKLSIDQLNFKPAPNEWSLLQVIHHLIDAERAAAVYINKKLQGAANIKKAGFLSYMRYMVLKIALLLPVKYKAPKAFAYPPDQLDYGQLRENWLQVRKEMSQIMEMHDQSTLSKELFKHPIAGRMNLAQAFLFMSSHIQHHMRQMDRIQQDKNFPGKDTTRS